MDFVNCPKCGKLFQRMSSPICENCEKLEEEIFQEVRKYVDDNPNSTMLEVSAITKVSVKKILKYLKDGRLEISTGMAEDAGLKCEKCSRPITKGHYCDACVINFNNEVVDIFNTIKKPEAKMHTKK